MYLTILIPCLNEEKTIGICIKKAQQFIGQNALDAEVLIVDNGCTDRTTEIAKNLNARIVKEAKKGYGNALTCGIKEATGEYIIMGDADDSYNFLELEEFINKLEQGYDLVIGNRYKGKTEKGAMKFLHKYIGTPVISWIARKKFQINIFDFNCGLRAFNKQKILKINCESEGMEYATEMIIKAKINNLKITEIPINFYKDKRERKPHLRTIRDGIRHLKLIFDIQNSK